MVGWSVTWMNYSLIIDADFGRSGGMCWVHVCDVDWLTLWHVDELWPNSLNTSWIQMPLSMWGLSTRCRCCGDYSRPVSHSVRWGQGCFKIGVLCLFLNQFLHLLGEKTTEISKRCWCCFVGLVKILVTFKWTWRPGDTESLNCIRVFYKLWQNSSTDQAGFWIGCRDRWCYKRSVFPVT